MEPEIKTLKDFIEKAYAYVEETMCIFLDDEGEPHKDDEYAKEMVDSANELLDYLDLNNN